MKCARVIASVSGGGQSARLSQAHRTKSMLVSTNLCLWNASLSSREWASFRWYPAASFRRTIACTTAAAAARRRLLPAARRTLACTTAAAAARRRSSLSPSCCSSLLAIEAVNSSGNATRLHAPGGGERDRASAQCACKGTLPVTNGKKTLREGGSEELPARPPCYCAVSSFAAVPEWIGCPSPCRALACPTRPVSFIPAIEDAAF